MGAFTDELLRELRRTGSDWKGYGDTAATIAKGAMLQPVAGIGGLLEALRTGSLDKGIERIDDTASLASPRTEKGAANLQGIGRGIEAVGDYLGNPIDKIGDTPMIGPLLGAATQGFVEVADPSKSVGRAARAAKGAAKQAIGKAAKGAGDAVERARTLPLAKDVPQAPTAPLEPETATRARTVSAPKDARHSDRFQSGEKAGIYRGTEAFGGMTPQKLGRARTNYREDAIKGAPYSKYWYDDTSKTIYDLTGGGDNMTAADILKADRLAHLLSVTSSSTPVKSNAMYGFKGWNQDLVGDPVRTGKYPTAMGKDIVEGLRDIDAGNLTGGVGLKRDPYRAGLSVNWRPDPDLRPTNDIHQMRAWGVTDPKTGKPWHKGVGEAGHRFIDTQTRHTVDALNERGLHMQEFGPVRREDQPDWNNYRVQASAWSPQRVKSGVVDTLEEAGGHYGSAVDPYSIHGTREWTPGETSGHLPEMLRADDAIKREYAQGMEDIVRGPSGNDRLATGMGALSAPTLANRGVYEGQTNPGFATRLPAGKLVGSDLVDPSSAKVADAVMGAHGLLGMQDQSAWNFVSGRPGQRDAGAFTFDSGAPFDEARLAALADDLRGIDVDIPQVDPRGARVLHFGDQFGGEMGDLQASAQMAGVPPSEARSAVTREYKPEITQRKAMVQALRDVGTKYGAGVEEGTRSSNLFPLKEGSYWEKPEVWSTKPFIEKIEAGGPKMVEGFDATMKGMAPQLLQHTQAVAAKHGFTSAAWFPDAMNALATGGLSALKELVKKGAVPVAFFSLAGETLPGFEEETQ